jgi:penicillin-binding protein 1C
MHSADWFVLPPAMEYFYVKRHAGYKPLPPFRGDCSDAVNGDSYVRGNDPVRNSLSGYVTKGDSLSILYPHPDSEIYVPLELTSDRGKTVFRAAHRVPNTLVYWHIDDMYMGSTVDFHQMSFDPEPGRHVLTLVDERGELLTRRFTVLSRNESTRQAEAP